MLRISRIADYGVVLATRLAQPNEDRPDEDTRSVPELARETGVPQPTVSKILKQLAREGILESTREVPKIVHWPRKTVGVRVPDHPVALALCAELGRPIISSTAARHGHAPNPDPKEIDEEFKGLALVVDAGPGGTVPTSIVDLTTEEPKIIREGAGDVTAFRA